MTYIRDTEKRLGNLPGLTAIQMPNNISYRNIIAKERF